MGALDSLCMYFERNAWRMDPDLEDVIEAIRLMESDNKIMPFVKGEWKLPIWAPTREDTNPDMMDHVRKLGIPLGNREEIPLVILHRLGSFQHDPILKKRLDTIFSPNHHTFLINTSGSGKTKLLFEGLCLHWGLYFTCAIDSSFLGAGDFVLAINDIESHRNWTGHLPFPSSPHYTTSLQHNIKTVFRLTSEALLARLLVFKMYLTACSKGALCHDHRQRWLESQIFPRTITSRFEAYGLSRRFTSTIAMHRSVISFLTTSKGCCDFTSNDIDLVNEDYGIFLDPKCSRIGLHEPITVIYGAKWLKQQPSLTLVRLAGTFAWNYQTEIHPSHFASSLALSLAWCFGDFCKVSNTCTVFGLTTPLLDGRLVKFVKVAERLETLDVQLSETMPDRLVFVAGAPEEVMSWFKHEHDEPFCLLPSSSSTSVTLVFCLKLSDERTFWVFVYVPSTFTRENPDFAQDIKEIHPNVIFRDQPEVVTLLDQLPNLNADVGPSGILRISGSFRVKSATVDSIPHEEYPAGVLNIGRLDKLTKEISQDMLMRRLSRIFTQEGRIEPFYMALPTAAQGDVSAIAKKRARSTSTDDAASTSRTDRTKVQKSFKDIVAPDSGPMTRKGRKGTRNLRTLRSNRNIRDVVTGRASVVVPRSSLVDSTVPSSPYNLRKQR
ncbi:hypothetical protein LENED_006781 [Lentinula edodes]|uniref:Uncharacterized protein n=1 Tax=Lentinula edodes TaxID=5353 RepID=A0A1Q3ECM1_LENED|nr:hypothetical protein LENED_006781 [Lentinula edodes]